jgi:hypothetical protein
MPDRIADHDRGDDPPEAASPAAYLDAWRDFEEDGLDYSDEDGDQLEKLWEAGGEIDWSRFPHWNVIPGEPGPCQRNLAVIIRSDREIDARLRVALIALRSCPQTRRVVFLLPGYLPSWRSHWVVWRSILGPLLDARARGRAWPLRIIIRGNEKKPVFFLRDGRPAGCAPMLEHWRRISHRERAVLRSRIRFLMRLGIETRYDGSLIGGYTGQPAGLNSKPVLTFGDWRGGAGGMHDWRIRIYLVAGFPVGVSELALVSGAEARMVPGRVPGHDNNAWIPADPDHFFDRPDEYIDRRSAEQPADRPR